MGSVPHPDSRVERHNALQLQENVFADMRLLQHDNEDEADDTKMEPLSTNNQNTWCSCICRRVRTYEFIRECRSAIKSGRRSINGLALALLSDGQFAFLCWKAKGERWANPAATASGDCLHSSST